MCRGGGGSGGGGPMVQFSPGRPAAPPGVAFNSGMDGPGFAEAGTVSATNEPRTYFPETWLWQLSIIQLVFLAISGCLETAALCFCSSIRMRTL